MPTLNDALRIFNRAKAQRQLAALAQRHHPDTDPASRAHLIDPDNPATAVAEAIAEAACEENDLWPCNECARDVTWSDSVGWHHTDDHACALATANPEVTT